VLISATLGIVAVIAHDRWRCDGWRIGSILGPFLFIMSLLAKESAIAVIAYLISYAVFIEQGSWKNRVLSLVPYVLIAVIWRIAWVLLGYGVDGMDFYIDPLNEPIRYMGLFLIRAPILLLGQFGFPPSEYTLLIGPEGTWILFSLATIFLSVLLILLLPLLRRDPIARFWGLGMILSLLSTTATIPSDRLLFFAGIGAMGLLAQSCRTLWSRDSILPGHRLRLIFSRTVLILLTVLHLLVPLAILPFRAGNPLGSKEMLNRLYVRTPFEPSVADQDLVIVNAPSYFHAAYLGSMRLTNGLPAPKRLRILSSGLVAVDLFRSDERTVIVKPEGGFLQGMLDQLYRAGSESTKVGETVVLEGMTVEVIAVGDNGYPAEVSFQFDVVLEDKSLLWLQYLNGEFVFMIPPAIGERVHLPVNPPIFSF
jgi:hypothetical protein